MAGAGSFSKLGSIPQISLKKSHIYITVLALLVSTHVAYSEMVRSLENFPLLAMLWMAISAHL